MSTRRAAVGQGLARGVSCRCRYRGAVARRQRGHLNALQSTMDEV